ncbi:MAG: glycerol-3-phosphate dehydrogenase/oxidase [Acidimicrobiales bacterium]
MPLGTFDRNENIASLAEGTYDVLIIGGGITGAGAALDAASRGLRTALVERDDFASGTSSKSSKLIHGGLRYLQNGDVRLVYEALRERQRLLRNAPHLVTVLPFLIPVFEGKGGIIPKRLARALGSAMWMYDLTGGLRIGKRHRRLDRDAALAHMPMLGERLAWAYLYYDAQADDARLTLTVARTAALDFGATVVNHAAVTAVVKDDSDRIAGAIVDAGAASGEIEVRAKVVINATGVWADDVRALDEGTNPNSIRPAKGIHIAVPWHKLRNDIAAVVPVRQDRRSVFVVPWPARGGGRDEGDPLDGSGDGGRVTYIGTTDTDYDGDVDDPQCTPEDVAYLLDAINHAISEPLEVSDVLGTWAGLRPLVRDASNSRTADLSRRHQVRTSAAGMVTVTGGKLTTYREMAEDAVDAASRALASAGEPLPRRARRSRTRSLPLRGAAGWREARKRDAHLAGRYGGEAAVVEAMIAADPTMGEALVPGLFYRRAEALYAARYEMAVTVDDVLSRRTRCRLLGRDATAAAARDVAELLAMELGWSEAERAAEVDRFQAALAHERDVPGLPENMTVAGSG